MRICIPIISCNKSYAIEIIYFDIKLEINNQYHVFHIQAHISSIAAIKDSFDIGPVCMLRHLEPVWVLLATATQKRIDEIWTTIHCQPLTIVPTF